MEYTDTKGSYDISDEDTLDLQAVVKSEMESAQDFIEQIGQERDEATRYYLGKEPGATSELQSEYISTDVRDSVLFMLPSIMRTFFGTKKVVEFVPHSAEDIPFAEQQTAYINHIIQEKNPGFQVMYNAFKDALIRKTGFVKAYWDDSITSTCHEFSNISPEDYTALIMDEDVEIVEEKMEMETLTIVNEMTGD